MKRSVLVATIALVATSPAAADALQDQVLAGMRATRTDDLAFTLTTRAEQTGSAPRQFVTRYDGQGHWLPVSVDGRAPTDKERQRTAKNHPPLPGYARLAQWFGGPATRVAASPGSVTYRFQRLPAGTVKLGSHDASADTVADAVVDTSGPRPFVSRVHFASSTPFRMMLVARVDRFSITSSYAPLADGRVFATGSDTDFAGSMLGKTGSIVTHSRYSDVRPAR